MTRMGKIIDQRAKFAMDSFQQRKRGAVLFIGCARNFFSVATRLPDKARRPWGRSTEKASPAKALALPLRVAINMELTGLALRQECNASNCRIRGRYNR